METSPYGQHHIDIEHSLPTHLRRTTSSILAEYPWQTTDLILQAKPLVENGKAVVEFQNFISALQEFESNLLNFEQDVEIKSTLALLGISVRHENGRTQSRIVSTHSEKLTNTDYHTLGSIISAYRFYEILCLYHNCATPVPRNVPKVPMYLPPSQGNETLKLRYYEHLESWPTTVSNFCNIVQQSKPRIAPTKPSSIAMMSLIDMLENNQNNAKYVATADNFLLMALTVAALKHFPFRKGSLPELPNSCPPIEYMLSADSGRKAESILRIREEYEDFRTAYNVFITKHRNDQKSSASSISFRNSFHLAVMISPLYLLAPCTLFKKAFNRRTIMEIASCLGVEKPEAQKATERLVMEAVFRLSEGKTDIYVVLTDLAKNIRKDILEKGLISETDTQCFQITEKLQYFGFPNTLTSLSTCLNMCSAASNDATDSSRTVLMPRSTTTTNNLSEINYDIFLALKYAWKYAPQYNIPLHTMPQMSESQSVTRRQYGPLRLTETEFTAGVDSENQQHANRDVNDVNRSTPSSTDMDNDAPFDVDDEYMGITNDYTARTNPNNQETQRSSNGQNLSNDAPSGNSSDKSTDNKTFDEDALSKTYKSSSDKRPDDEPADKDAPSKTIRSQEQVEQTTSSKTSLNTTGKTTPTESSSDESSDEEPLSKRTRSHKQVDEAMSVKTTTNATETKQLLPTNALRVTRSATGTYPKRKAKPATPADTEDDKTDSENGDQKDSNFKKGIVVGLETFRVPKRPASPDNSLSTSGTSENPINVDSLVSIFEAPTNYEYTEGEKITLAPQQVPQISSDKEYTVFNSKGEAMKFSPRFHHDDQHQKFDQFMTRVQKCYTEGKAPHITAPEITVIKTYAYKDWQSLSTNQRHEILSKKNVVVSGWPIEDTISFDEEGIRKVVGPLIRQISIQDYSIKPSSDADITVSGYVEDILNNQGPSGKILNALDLPLFEMDTRRAVHTSDIHAWEITRGLHRIHQKTQYAREDMRWALAGLKNAMTYIHVDCDGLATDIRVLCGAKLWGFVRSYTDTPVQSPKFFLHNGFALDEVTTSSYYRLEAIVLQPGDRLFMLPGQPHFVYGIEDTLCEGGHHYLTHQMQETFHGLIHTFMLHNFLTNTAHHPSRTLLRRMVIFYHIGLLEKKVKIKDPAYEHLPKVETFKGLMDLMSACILVILGNVLDLRTYQTPIQSEIQFVNDPCVQEALQDVDINNIPMRERLAICYARGVALRLLEWIRDCAIVTDYSGHKIDDIPTNFLHQTITTLTHYNSMIIKKELGDERPFENEMFCKQLDNIRTIFQPTWIIPEKVDVHYLGREYNDYTVVWDDITWSGGDQDFLKAGTTPLDKKYFIAQKERQHYEKHFVLARLQEKQEPGPSKRTKVE